MFLVQQVQSFKRMYCVIKKVVLISMPECPFHIYVYDISFFPISWFNTGSIYQQFLNLTLSIELAWINFIVAHKGKGSFSLVPTVTCFDYFVFLL